MHRRNFLMTSLAAIPAAFAGCSSIATAWSDQQHGGDRVFEVTKTEAEWRQILTADQFDVLRKAGTERPGSSPLNAEKRAGLYHCAGCDLALYSSTTKYDSGTGWPSFTAPLANAVATSVDKSLFGTRTEVHCRRCGGHHGHVFDDGPKPTGQRYCMNGVALTFRPATGV